MKYFASFDSVCFNNVLIFKGKNEIPLKNQGIVSVIGKNKDTGSSNGAGKSTIFDIMRAIHLGSSCDGTKDINFLSNDGPSYMGYVAHYGTDCYDITKYRNDKVYKNNTIVLKNSKSIGAKKNVNDIKKAISTSYVKIPEAVWDNCVILRTDKAHTLINGSPSERIEFLSNLCQLNCYDDVEDILKDKLSVVSDKIDSLRESEAIYADVSESLSKSRSREELNSRVHNLDRKSEAVSKKVKLIEQEIDSCNKRVDLVSSIIKISNDIERFGYNGTSEDLHNIILNNKKELSRIDESIYNLKIISNHIKEYDELSLKIHNSNIISYNCSAGRKKLAKLKIKISKLTEKFNAAKELKSYKDKLDSIPVVDKSDLDKLDYYNQELVKVKLMLTLTRHKYDKCPICNRIFSDGYKLSINKDSLKVDFNKISKNITRLEDLKSTYEERERLKNKISSYPDYNFNKLSMRIKKLSEKETRISDKISKCEKMSSYVDRYSKLKSLIGENTSTKVTNSLSESKKSKESLSNKIESDTYLYSKLVDLEELENSSGITRDKADYFIKEVTSKLEKLSSIKDVKSNKLMVLLTRLGKEKESLSSVESLIFKRDTLEEKLSALPELNRKKQFLSNLCYAYSSKGLKATKINNILCALKIKIQDYVSVLFSEKDIDFDVKGDNRSFSIICIRRDNKGKEIARYDVKRLSGGEKARFVLAIVFALDDITSPNMKVNFKVLDEIDAKLDSAGKRVLIERFIPMLRKKTDTLFIVSHDPEVRDANIYDSKLIVTKKDSSSVIKIIKFCKRMLKEGL